MPPYKLEIGTYTCFILGSLAGGGFATKIRRSYCPRKANGFAATFSGIANNGVVCNRGQYTKLDPLDCIKKRCSAD